MKLEVESSQMFSDWFHLEVQKWVLIQLCFVFTLPKLPPHFYHPFLFDSELFHRSLLLHVVSHQSQPRISCTTESYFRQTILSKLWRCPSGFFWGPAEAFELLPALNCATSSFHASLTLTVNFCSSLIKLKRMSNSLFSSFPTSISNKPS